MTIKEKQKKQIKDLHEKYYGKKSQDKVAVVIENFRKDVLAKKAQESNQLAQETVIVKEPVLGNTGEKAGSRADLMDQAKLFGIKYFRILKKSELEEVIKLHVEGGMAKDGRTFTEIIDGAKARWKAGWSKNKEAK